jgi:hypothetical protein
MAARHQIESYKFWDIVTLWAKEQLESEELVARALAKGVVRDGLKLQSIDSQWTKAKAMELKAQPYVGFCAVPGAEMAVLRAEALEHLLGVVRQARRPSRTALKEEFITKDDFRRWLQRTRQQLPAFWFSRGEGAA